MQYRSRLIAVFTASLFFHLVMFGVLKYQNREGTTVSPLQGMIITTQPSRPQTVTVPRQKAERAQQGTVAAPTQNSPSGSESNSPAIGSECLDLLQKRVLSYLVYPRSLRRMGVEGKVMIEMILNADGFPESSRVLTSSGYSQLDEAALSAVERAKPFLCLTEKTMGKPKVSLPILFRIK